MLEILFQDTLCGNLKSNQDALIVKKFPNGDYLLAVADGMGGGVLGTELSQEAVNILDLEFTVPVKYPTQKLKQIAYNINDALHELLSVYDIRKRERLYFQKGGTTLCVVYYSADKSKISYLNIGDSRISICGNRKLKNLSVDQNRYEEKKLNGEEPRSEDKRIISAVLGVSTNMEIDEMLENKQWAAMGQKKLSILEDIIVLSTDGFHDYIDQNTFCKDFHSNFSNEFDRVKEVSQDNISVIVAKRVL